MSARGEVCVCQLTHGLEASQPSVSKHLAVLREAGLVEQRRAAQWILYRIADLPDWAQAVVDGALARESKPSRSIVTTCGAWRRRRAVRLYSASRSQVGVTENRI